MSLWQKYHAVLHFCHCGKKVTVLHKYHCGKFVTVAQMSQCTKNDTYQNLKTGATLFENRCDTFDFQKRCDTFLCQNFCTKIFESRCDTFFESRCDTLGFKTGATLSLNKPILPLEAVHGVYYLHGVLNSETRTPMKNLVCIQCSMKALLAGEALPQFDETVEEHMRKHHPDPSATKTERVELEKKLASKLNIGGL